MSATQNTLAHILVATDFSGCAAAATEWASHLAAQHDARMTLIHATDTASAPPNLPEYIQKDLDATVETHLSGTRQHLEKAGISVASEFRAGRPWKVVLDAARRLQPDLIVVGQRGRSDFARALLGSTAHRIIRAADAPVVTVHPDVMGQPFALNTIVAGIDFSESSERSLQAVLRLCTDKPVTLVLVHASHLPVDYDAGAIASAVAEHLEVMSRNAAEQLKELASRLDLPDHVTVETISQVGHPVPVLTEEARARNADLLLMGTQGHSGLKHLMLGSVAERVLSHAPCPVMTLRCQE